MDLKDLKKTVRERARQQLDHALLSFNHSGISKLAAGLKDIPSGGADLISRIGQNVLGRADAVRASLVASVSPRRAQGPKVKAQVRPAAKKARTPSAKRKSRK